MAEAHNICVPYHSMVPLDSKTLEFATRVTVITDVIRHKLIKGVVFIGNRATAKEFMIKLQIRASFPRFIFSEAVGLQDSVFHHVGIVLSLSKGAFVVSPPSRPLPEFRDFWNDIWSNRTLFLEEAERNPWLGGYFSDLALGCPATDDQCWANTRTRRPLLDHNTRWLFEYYNIKAVSVFAALLKKMVSDYCQGETATGLCVNLRDVLTNSRQTVQNLLQTSSFNLEEEFSNVTSAFVNFTSAQFDKEGEIMEQVDGSVYDVFNFQRCQHEKFCFRKVGGLTSQNDFHLNLSAVKGYNETGVELTSPNLPKAQCSKNAICAECLPSDIADEIIMVPGDFYFVAVVPVYDRDRVDVLGCGNIRTSAGADMAQSVLFALDKVNAKDDGVFRDNKKLGVIIFNSCYRELVMKRTLIDFFGGRLLLPGGTNSSDILPLVAGYVGAFFSSVSVAMYEVLTKMTSHFVMLSPANTSPNLSDRDKYPLYLRLTTKSDAQARAMLDIVVRLNSSYVQVVYDPEDDYSSGLKEAIEQLSHSAPFNICVIQNVNTSYDDDSLGRVRDKLLQYSWVPVVIVVLQYDHARNFTSIVTTAIKPGQFIFIGSEAWERRREMLEPAAGREKRLERSLVLYQGLPVDRQFDHYFKKLNPISSINPWLRYFWEAAGDCYFQDSFEKRGKRPCPVSTSGSVDSTTRGYVQSVWVPFYINAVKVFAKGLHSAMMDKCQALSLCERLSPQDLIRHLKGVRMDMMGTRQQQPVFDANGDGWVGYDVYQVQRRFGHLTYEKVGSYLNGLGTLRLSPPYPRSGRCLTQEQCHRCFPPPPSLNTCRMVDDDSTDANRSRFIVVLVLFIALLLACGIVIGFYLLRRRRKTLLSMNTPTSSLRRLQNLDPSEMTSVPESVGSTLCRLHSVQSSLSSACTCGAGRGAAGGFGSGSGSSGSGRMKEDSAYEDISHHHGPNPHPRQGSNPVLWRSCQPPPPTQPPFHHNGLPRSPSNDVGFHEEYVARDDSVQPEDHSVVSAMPGPFIIFANEWPSAGSVTSSWEVEDSGGSCVHHQDC
ncbi:hypothetical protein ACOMHN_002138 [Nucella lapillus]